MIHYLFYSLIALAVSLAHPFTGIAGATKTGFLVLAPDRGFLGNQEIQLIFDEFSRSYAPTSLAWIGRDYNGVGTEYSAYLSRAVAALREAGTTEIVAIPLFLSRADPVLQKAAAYLPAYLGGQSVRWAPTMVASYLVHQIVLDRVEALSREPEQERLVLLGVGARDDAEATAMQADIETILSYITQRKRFKEARVGLYYDRAAPRAGEKNKLVDQLIIEAAAKKGRTLAVLAAIGPKFDHSMALTAWLGQKFKELDVAYADEELLPHPNVLLWIKKTANAYLPASPADMGVVIMPHGAMQPWNDAVERVIAPLKSRYRIEMAYGMGDPLVIQQTVSRLEQQGVRRIVFVRMYALANHLKGKIDYILGLSDSPTPEIHGDGHDHEALPPPQVRSAALFATFGGYEEYPGIAEALHDRITEISEDPERETVILVAHGDKTDQGNTKWLSVMHANIARLKQDPHCTKLKAIRAATVREDWPELREEAVAGVRQMIQEGAQDGRTLVIADRLYGAGPYRTLFNGLEYVLNDKGLAHPAVTRWLESGINQAASILARPITGADGVAER